MWARVVQTRYNGQLHCQSSGANKTAEKDIESSPTSFPGTPLMRTIDYEQLNNHIFIPMYIHMYIASVLLSRLYPITL
jgi:hypothetical protein